MDNQQHQPSRTPWDSPTAAELAQMQRAAAPHSRAEEGEVQSVRLSGVKEAGSGQEKQQSQQHYYTPVKQVGSGGKKRAGIICAIVLGLVLVGAAGFGGGLLAADKIQSDLAGNLDQILAENGSTVLYRSVSTEGEGETERETLSVADVAELCADSVVEIATETAVDSWGLFGQSSYLVPGAGSGVIISDTGHILTCTHVIEDARTIEVRLRNGESYPATLVASDEASDVAIIKIEATSELTPAVFGSSDDLRVGDEVVAIGNPLGELGGSVTEGVVSALDREVTIQGKGTFTVIQTSAAINGGNSGGGLFNRQGELIGMVNAKAEDVGVEGLGFALPIDNIIGIIEDLLNYGYVTDGGVTLGVMLVDINDERSAATYGVDEYGCYIYQVNADSNAAYAGLRAGDRIIAIDGQKIDNGDEVVEIIAGHRVNDSIDLLIERNGREMEVGVTLYGNIPNSATPTALF